MLKDITLSFYPGAKIGVIGANGSGKSSLLRIMAGVDDGYTGEARLTPGFTVGLLEQEPQLDESKDVIGNVMDGVGQVAGLLTEYDEVLAGWADPDADYEKLGAEQADLEAKIEAAGAWDLQRTIEIAMDALRLPPGDAEVDDPLRRRAAPGGAVPPAAVAAPTCCCSTSPPTTSTPSRWPGSSASCTTTRARSWPSPTTATSSTTWPAGSSSSTAAGASRSRATTRAGSSRSRPGSRRRRRPTSARRRTLERELEWVRMAPKARQAKGKARLTAYEKLLAEAQAAERGPDKLQINIPPGPRLGDQVIEAERPVARATATGCSSRTCRSRCRRPASSASSGPTAPARPRCSA